MPLTSVDDLQAALKVANDQSDLTLRACSMEAVAYEAVSVLDARMEQLCDTNEENGILLWMIEQQTELLRRHSARHKELLDELVTRESTSSRLLDEVDNAHSFIAHLPRRFVRRWENQGGV